MCCSELVATSYRCHIVIVATALTASALAPCLGRCLSFFLTTMFIVRLPNPIFWLNLEILCKVFFWIDFGSLGSTLSESAGCTPGTLERFEKFKMASKMAAVSDNSL